MTDRKKADETREAKLKFKDEKRQAHDAKVVNALTTIAAWIPENLSLAGVKRLQQLSDTAREKELTKMLIGKDFEGQTGQVDQACLALQDSCKGALKSLLVKTSKILSKQKLLSTEIKDGQKIKSEIAHDVTRLSKQVEAAVNERSSL